MTDQQAARLNTLSQLEDLLDQIADADETFVSIKVEVEITGPAKDIVPAARSRPRPPKHHPLITVQTSPTSAAFLYEHQGGVYRPTQDDALRQL
ncbi:MAG: hypothetical protein AAF253_12990 [Pseudomonadota bacterium]